METPIQDSIADAAPEKEFIFEGEVKAQLMLELIESPLGPSSREVIRRFSMASRIRVSPMSAPVPPELFRVPEEARTHLTTVVVTPTGDVGCRVWYAE